ncbi:class I SAM-dependent methyltransferase [Ferruginibacter sp. SUN002]|uniref:class I SAM-dependent methyltransferase n=1 Tax=Ferruginibacter sp. SUN002 TaxID=2937789 RepID=UPI003D363B95
MSIIKSPIQYYNNIQLEYFSQKIKKTMVPANTPYVNRHVDELINYGKITKTDRVLDVGCGMGKYTLNMLAKGYKVEGLDLNAFLLQQFLRYNDNRFPVKLHLADIIEAPEELNEQFDYVIGFMVLHHLHILHTCFQSMYRLLKPGGKIIFLEPNPYNPLFHMQIWFTPGMSYEGEKGLKDMTRKNITKALNFAEFENVGIHRFGAFPPAIYNKKIGGKLDHMLSKAAVLSPVMAFQLISATKPLNV